MLVAYLVALVTGRLPSGLHRFIAAYLRYYSRVMAYAFLLADAWPPFTGSESGYPIDVRIAPAATQSRLTVFFRLILILPAALLIYVFRLVNEIVAFGYACLLTGRYPSLSGGPQL
jgi:hypothetical protein